MKNETMTILDNASIIKKYDPAGMLGLISNLPDNCLRAKDRANDVGIGRLYARRYDNIVCAGLGGSAIGADIVRSYIAGECRTPFYINRSYDLPGFVDNNSLVIASSYSGNTEETLSAYKQAKSKGARVIVITAGGRLKKLASKDGFTVFDLPAGLPPRCALGYSAATLLVVLSKIGVIKDQSKNIDEAVRVMYGLHNSKLSPSASHTKNIAKHLAARLYGHYPVIYGSQDKMGAVVTRWRGQLAENAKTLSSSALLPEMNHNEVVGWDNPAKILKSFSVVMIRDMGNGPRLARRFDITKRIINGKCANLTEVNSYGKGLLARIFSLVHIGDFVSFYLAILNKCDPTPVERINYLKKELAKK